MGPAGPRVVWHGVCALARTGGLPHSVDEGIHVPSIVLTGGIASGKSTIASRLTELGAHILDADVFARDAVAPGSIGLDRIRDEFGSSVISADGSLDRAALGKIVFSDETARQKLNAIVHPEVRRLTAEAKAEILQTHPDAFVIHDIPLFVETGAAGEYDEVWVAEAPVRERMRRLVEGRGMSRDEAESRIRAQASDEERRAVADVIIDTGVPIAETLAQVDALWERVSGATNAQ